MPDLPLNMADVQRLITAVNESQLSPEDKRDLRRKLDLMQTALLHEPYIKVTALAQA